MTSDDQISRFTFDPENREALAGVCREFGVRMLVLFGSHAPGGLPPQPESDVDLAIAFRPDAPQTAPWKLHEAFSGALPGVALDLALLGGADPLLRWEIMREGVLLHGDVDDFLEFRAYAYRDFVDSADLRSLERVLSEKKLTLIRERLRAAS